MILNDPLKQYKEQILGHFDEVLSHDMNASPSYMTMQMIRDNLIEKGMKPELADDVVTRIQVMVADEIFEDEDFMLNVTENFAEVISRIHETTCQLFNYSTRQAFINLIDGMSLTLVPPT